MPDVATNRQASYRYHLLDKWECGLVLTGTEVKSLRQRKLLMHRREIERLIGKTKEKGLTLVPTRLYFKGRHAKVEIALARGKDRGDKRQAIKEREMRREMERAIRR